MEACWVVLALVETTAVVTALMVCDGGAAAAADRCNGRSQL